MNVVGEFWYFDGGEQLTGADTVADIDGNGFEVASDLCMDLDFLIRAEFGVANEFLSEIFARDPAHCNLRR